ncbi:DUF6538 domain-containing protein [Jannaschia marina]|uniref:DUF6538 domain-containing protein n=1 Tax=Jannaschia marina TaxID=2741674 RepID=UPI0015C92CE7|nr:DUF6538 domain-containing protein [Jannaschia marina]
MTVKYLAKRGNTYQFARRVPNDIRATLNINHWRWSLKTDSRTEAEIVCRRHAVETDQIIDQVRNGTYRQFTDEEIDNLAVQWGLEFQLVNSDNIATTVFPNAFQPLEPMGEEEKNPVFASRDALQSAVERWLQEHNKAPNKGTADWDKLIDACLDEYLVGNPEISDEWLAILAERGLDFSGNYLPVVERPRRVDQRSKLSSVFGDFKAGDHDLDTGTISEYQLSVDRFISVFGDLDINDITRERVKEYRDLLRNLPARPPNEIRRLPIEQQVQWAEGKETKRIGQNAINKNFLGVKAALNHADKETSILSDPHWRNPFDGFSKRPKKADNPRRRFTDDQIKIVFSSDIKAPTTVAKFWIPIVLFYTGARLTEISQLHVSDVILDPIPHLHLENLDDEDPIAAKKLKTESSHRTVPLHQDLIEVGFLEYVASVRKSGHKHLFPELPHHKREGVGDLVSRDFINRFRALGRSRPESGLNTKSLVTHSLRHTFRVAALSAGDQKFVEIIMGHYVSGVSIQVYGSEAYIMPELLAGKVLRKMELPPVDKDFLHSEARRWIAL